MILFGVGGICDLARLVAAEQAVAHSPLSAPCAAGTPDDATDDPTRRSGGALLPAR